MNTSRFKQLLESSMGNVKPLILEQPDTTKKLNLFCQGAKDQRRETGLTFESDRDMNGGIKQGGYKQLYLNVPSSPVAQEYEAAGDTIFVRIINANNPNLDGFKKTIGVENQEGNLVILYTPTESNPYFCTLDAGTDQEWADYFNSI